MDYAAHFFAYARERYKIKQRRERGDKAPWTSDSVLQQFRFCHVFREDDKVTQWFRENIRDRLNTRPDQQIFATIAFRWFNRIETGELIKPWLLTNWNGDDVRRALKGVAPVVTGAYMITSPPGMKKMPGIVHNISKVTPQVIHDVRMSCTLQEAHTVLSKVPYLGKFHSYEMVCDLQHTPILRNASDIYTWANPGPGCKRGLQWVGDVPKVPTAEMMPMMAMLLAMSGNPKHWPTHWPKWDMRTVEHTLCEYDKYRRGHNGQRLKRKFTNGSQ